MFVSNSKFLYLYVTMDQIAAEYTCGYCGERNETLIDPSAGLMQSYVEDCAVCCHPNVLTVRINRANGEISLEAQFEG